MYFYVSFYKYTIFTLKQWHNFEVDCRNRERERERERTAWDERVHVSGEVVVLLAHYLVENKIPWHPRTYPLQRRDSHTSLTVLPAKQNEMAAISFHILCTK
jgi:hypothetical protein